MSDIVIRAENLSKRYRIGKRERYKTLRDTLIDNLVSPFRRARLLFQGKPSPQNNDDDTIWALNDVSFEIKRGEVVGIIGRNGAGKSTLLKILSRITEPTGGFAEIRGRVGSLLEVGTGFHPELTGRENIYLNGAILGMKKAEITKKFDEIVAFAETEKFLDTPVKHYSSGMRVRLAFAVAAYLEPEILLVDEVLAVGDAAFQKKCLGKIGDVAKEGRTVLFVSHQMATVQNLCRTAYLLDQGKIVATGEVNHVVQEYLKTVTSSERTFLGDRRDRKGNGNLQFVEFLVSSGGQEKTNVVCGAAASFVIRYKSSLPIRNVQISVGIFTILGEGALYLSNDLIGKELNDLPPSGAMVCHFDKLPLLPGTYSANLYCTINGVLADWIVDAARFDVGEGDYFGTGKLPPKGYGAVMVPHEWDVIQT